MWRSSALGYNEALNIQPGREMNSEKNIAEGWASAIGAEELAGKKGLKIKMGFDPTAPDLHLGHAVGLLALRRLQDQGHSVALIVGDFTAAIGDPTGRNDMRPQLGAEQIAANAKTYADQALRILDAEKTEILFNSAWLEKLGAAGMIALGAKATVAQMLAREDFGKRFAEQAPIGLHELIYPLLQARDSVEICPDAEVGGSDQRFNLLMGRELMREAGQKPQACFMVGLLVGLDGKRKMSKSLGNHIGLSEPAEDIFAKTMSISDQAMEQWRETLGADGVVVEGNPMESKKLLASWIVERLAGVGQGLSARASWEASRQNGDWSQAPEMSQDVGAEGEPWASLLRDWGWEASAGKARERIAQGALKINGEKMLDPKARLMPGFEGLVRYGAKKAARLTSREHQAGVGERAAPRP